MKSARSVTAAVLVLFWGAPVACFAADDMASLRSELEALKADYASKVSALELVPLRQADESAANPLSTPPSR